MSFTQRERNYRTRHSTLLQTKFRFLNPSPHPSIVLYQDYTQIAWSRGLEPIVPFFVPNHVLRTIDNATVNTRGMRSSVFFLDFDRAAGNWQTAQLRDNRRPHKRFTGGTVTATAVASIFIDDRARFKRRAILKIMEHEMDHARDSKASMNQAVIRGVRQDQLIRDHLINRQPIEASYWRQWFGSAQPSPYRQRVQAILAAAHTVDTRVRLVDPRSSDPLVAQRAIDSFLFVRIWKPISERLGAALHRNPAHVQTMNEVVGALSDPDDPELYREYHGRLPGNVG